MAAQILPDGSILFRLGETAILFDLRSHSVIVEDLADDPSEADTAFHRPFATARMVWLVCKARTKPRLSVVFVGDDMVDLGLVPNQEAGLQLACELGNLMGCSIEVDDARARPRRDQQPAPSRRADPLEQETQRIEVEPRLGLGDDARDPADVDTFDETIPIAFDPVFDDSNDDMEQVTDATWEPIVEDLTDLFVEERRASDVEDPASVRRDIPPRHHIGRERAKPSRDKRRSQRRKAVPHLDGRSD